MRPLAAQPGGSGQAVQGVESSPPTTGSTARPRQKAASVTIEQLGSVGELVAALATVATLIYLAAQIRQNTRQARLGAFQNLTDRNQQWSTDLARDPELTRIYSAGLMDPPSLNAIERIRFDAILSVQFRNWEDVFLHHRRGFVDDEVWEARHASFRIFLAEPGLRWYWKRRKSIFTQSFRDFVDGEMDAVVVRDPSNTAESNG